MRKLIVRAKEVPTTVTYIIPMKEYIATPVRDDVQDMYTIITESGAKSTILIKHCAHLGGEDWEVVGEVLTEEETEAVNVKKFAVRKNQDTIRVLRVLEYIGPRSEVEKLVKQSISGEKYIPATNVTVIAATLGTFPEILEDAN